MSSSQSYERVIELTPEAQSQQTRHELKQQAIEEYDLKRDSMIDLHPKVNIPLTPREKKILASLRDVLAKEARFFSQEKTQNVYYDLALALFSAHQKKSYQTKTRLSKFQNRTMPDNYPKLILQKPISLIGGYNVYEAIALLSLHCPTHAIVAPETIFHGCELTFNYDIYERCYDNGVVCQRNGCGHVSPKPAECNSETYCEIFLEFKVPTQDRKTSWIPEWLSDCLDLSILY